MKLSFFAIVVCANLAVADLSFRSPTVTGRTAEVVAESDTRLHVVCFLGAQCPMARIYGPQLSSMAAEFRDRSVNFVGINSNRQDSVQEVRQYVTSLELDFPIVKDKENRIADQFGATRTPEIFVLDQYLKIRYHGRIDDQYEPGISRAAPKRNDLRIAIEELLAGKDVTVSKTLPTGCIIGRVSIEDEASQIVAATNDITYSKHVSRVLQKHCVECHRDGDIGPFAMNSYDEVAGWAETMLETIDNGRMPPWHANPQYGEFQNHRQMPESDKQIFRDWIAGGMKQGSIDDLPQLQTFTDGWQLDRKPDLVVSMRDQPFSVPANGIVEYQYFVADPKLTEDKWIRAAQVIPGNRSVVHHAIVFVRPPDGSRFRGLGWLTAYVPGQRPMSVPEHHARFVPKGSRLVFQMHYTPTGRVQSDISKVGLLFEDESNVTHELFTVAALNQEFEIPPNTDSHVVEAEVPWLPKHGYVLAASPHMHYRGRSFQLFADSDKSKLLLDVPQYDFNWQHTYTFKKPLPVSQLPNLRFAAAFDNSGSNPFNPDPSEWVTWGDQTWEEMAVAFFEVAEPRDVPQQPSKNQEAVAESTDKPNDALEDKINRYVARVLSKLDANGDEKITRDESPIVVRYFSFDRIDQHPRDGSISKEELRKVAEERYQ